MDELTDHALEDLAADVYILGSENMALLMRRFVAAYRQQRDLVALLKLQVALSDRIVVDPSDQPLVEEWVELTMKIEDLVR